MSWKTSTLYSALVSFVGMGSPKSPEELSAAVDARAARYMSPQFALHVPAGGFSSCVSVHLPTDQRETAPVSIEFNEPVFLVGIHFDIHGPTLASFDYMTAPHLTDVLVRVELPRSKTYLNQRTTSPASTLAEGFAPLSALDISTRLLCLPIQDPSEKIRLVYRSVYASAESAPAASNFPAALTLTATAIWMPQ